MGSGGKTQEHQRHRGHRQFLGVLLCAPCRARAPRARPRCHSPRQVRQEAMGSECAQQALGRGRRLGAPPVASGAQRTGPGGRSLPYTRLRRPGTLRGVRCGGVRGPMRVCCLCRLSLLLGLQSRGWGGTWGRRWGGAGRGRAGAPGQWADRDVWAGLDLFGGPVPQRTLHSYVHVCCV